MIGESDTECGSEFDETCDGRECFKGAPRKRSEEEEKRNKERGEEEKIYTHDDHSANSFIVDTSVVPKCLDTTATKVLPIKSQAKTSARMPSSSHNSV